MNCPFCGSSQIMVVNSRPTAAASQIWRRRKCLRCRGVFTTYEKINLSHLVVIKKSGRRQRYNRAKLFGGIYHSMLGRKNVDRGDAAEFSEETTNKVEQEILKLKRKVIQTGEITTIVLNILKKKAPDNFLRFVAYREGPEGKRVRQLLKSYP